MRIQYCSDLHLEFPENRKFLARNPILPVGDILLLAGDIVNLYDLDCASEFFDRVCDQYPAVYWVPGNHEYYGFDITDKPNPLLEKLRDNLFLVNNSSLIHGGVRFIFSTLWGRISPHLAWDIQRSVADFSAIRYQGRLLTTTEFSFLHEESLLFLNSAFRDMGNEPTVVISHHVPTLKNYPKMYKNSPLNEAFAVELFDLIESSGVDYWIYGHHHFNAPSFTIGRAGMLTNQLGYVRHHEHGSFRWDAVVDLTKFKA